MSYLNKLLSLSEQRELLQNEGLVLKRDTVSHEENGEFDGFSIKESESDSPINDQDVILWNDEFCRSGIPASVFNTLESFLKWKTQREKELGRKDKEYEIKKAVSLLKGLGVQSIS